MTLWQLILLVPGLCLAIYLLGVAWVLLWLRAIDLWEWFDNDERNKQ